MVIKWRALCGDWAQECISRATGRVEEAYDCFEHASDRALGSDMARHLGVRLFGHANDRTLGG